MPTCRDFFIVVTSTSLPASTAIQQAGFLPFYHPFATDHRGLFVDIDVDSIFGKIKPDTTKDIYRRFNISNMKRCDKYVKRLKEMLEKSNMFEKTKQLQRKFNEHLQEDSTKHDKDELIEECTEALEAQQSYEGILLNQIMIILVNHMYRYYSTGYQ